MTKAVLDLVLVYLSRQVVFSRLNLNSQKVYRAVVYLQLAFQILQSGDLPLFLAWRSELMQPEYYLRLLDRYLVW